MNKILLPILVIAVSCSKVNKNTNHYQIIITPEKEYYTKFYNVDLKSGCIDFTSYTDNDSSYVKVCEPWAVKSNTEYKP